MFNWAKQQLANVAGTQEPIYGPEAIRSVAQQAAETPYTEATREHLKWPALEQTSVATQVFYMLADSGHIAMAQVIYSSVAGLRTTVHFNTKIFYPNQTKPILWSKDPLYDFGFDEDNYSFFGEGCSIDLSEDGKSYTIKSAVNDKCLVDIKMSRVAPGFVVGKDGTSSFGTDPSAPWGVMRHAFWPRCKVEGHFITKEGQIDFKGAGLFIHAFQGMKPHHAAAKWNFSYFQGPTHSAIMMEFITPPSYGTTVVNVGGVVTDDKIVFASAQGTVTHTEKKEDPENQWPEPIAATYLWKGKNSDGKDVSAEISGSLGDRLDRIDIMSEVPGFIKSIVANAAGTKPYIYQWAPTNKTLSIKTGEEEAKEEGKMFIEATFIS